MRLGPGRSSWVGCDSSFVGDFNRANFSSIMSISEECDVGLFLGLHDCELEDAVVLDAVGKEEGSDGVEERDKSSGEFDSVSDERSLMIFRSSEPVPLGRAVGVDSAPSDDISEGQRS